MQNKEIIALISEQRFSTYEKLFVQIVPTHASSDDSRKVAFYMDIQGIYSHFFVPIQVLEITLRNRIHNSQSTHYSTSNWFSELRKDKTCTYKTRKMYTNTQESLKKANDGKKIPNKVISPEDYVGALNFGFWVELLCPAYRSNNFWQLHADDVFPNKEKVSLGSIYHSLQRANKARNRLYHYEPLWNTTKSFTDINAFCKVIEEQYSNVMNLIKYCSICKESLVDSHKTDFESAMKSFKEKYKV